MDDKEVVGDKAPSVLDITSIDIYLLLGLFVNVLGDQAWQYMGLRVRPATKKVEKDLSKARVAIDCVSYLIGKLEPQLNDEEKNKLRSLLTDLQINFIRQQS
jgi:hypothetical protein